MKNIFGNSNDVYAVHVVLYTCASSRSIKLDLVPDPSCIAFVQSLKRFIGQFGVPKLFISDNATCFIGPELTSFVNSVNTKWTFILEVTPWWGGFWERLVQTVKRCMRKILGKSKLNYEELLTVIAEVEGVVNSRPLCYIYDENIDEVLTPSHLLYGRRLLSSFNENNPENLEYTGQLTKRMIYLNTVLKYFWNKWSHEYLSELREHHKFNKLSKCEMRIGDVVLVYEDKLPRNKWRMGVIIELFTGKDGYVRGAKIRTITKTGKVSFLNRPREKLYPLEVNDDTVKISDINIDRKKVNSLTDDENVDNVISINLPKSNRPRRVAAETGMIKRILNEH